MLSRKAIKYLLQRGLIQVEPEPTHIGPNSIDLHLGDSLKMYKPVTPLKVTNPALAVTGPHYDYEGRVKVVDPVHGATYYAIDPRKPPPLVDVPKLADGRWLLVPSQFYIGVTQERTYTRGVVPHIDGRSTCGRLSIEAHKTAGVGDNGFDGQWTLEIEVTEPVLVAPGDRLFQVYFTPCWGEKMGQLIHDYAKEGDLRTLLELNDLYGGEGHHYQGSREARGAAPLDD
jgi:deoxycytidine triphosphate deaminase